MPALTAPTLSAAQEADLETYKQVYELLDGRLTYITADELHGRITKREFKPAAATINSLMEQMSNKAKAITGCPFGIWLD